MASTLTCMAEIQAEIRLYWAFVYASLTLTLICAFVRNYSMASEHRERRYRPLSRFLMGAGSIKAVFGILLLTVLLPKCPTDCVCTSLSMGHFAYGYVALGLGLLWIHQGYLYHQKAQQVVAASYASTPTVQMTEKDDLTARTTENEDDNELV